MIAGQGTLRPIEIIEDLVPLRDVTVKLRVSRHIRSAKRVPGGINTSEQRPQLLISQ